ncbi:hypothetical protein UT300012_33160 [Paraclostridium bifermentans]
MENKTLDYLYGLKRDIEESCIWDIEDAVVKQTEIRLVEDIINHIENLGVKE